MCVSGGFSQSQSHILIYIVAALDSITLACNESFIVVEAVLVGGFDVVNVLVDDSDGVDTASNGLSFDCGTGFCATGLVVKSNFSFTDIS